ncbi:unnamed protein product, partial [Mesorhabditis spiculigera]
MALKPVATVAPAIWDSLIEGQQTPTLRVKRKGGMGGGRGAMEDITTEALRTAPTKQELCSLSRRPILTGMYDTKIPKPSRIDILYYNGSPNQLPEKKAVVLNTFSSGSWRLEDRAEFMPIDDWRLFDLTMKPEKGKLKIFINNFEFATYEENRQLKSSTHFAIQGDVEILSVRSDG